MKTTNAGLFSVSALLMVLILCHPNAYADPSGGGSTTVSVAEAVHAAAQVAALAEQFDQVMAQYESEVAVDRRKELLKQAKSILAQLIEQANDVESEISIMAQKKLDKVYAQKLERVLSNVRQMKAAAESKMQSAGQEG